MGPLQTVTPVEVDPLRLAALAPQAEREDAEARYGILPFPKLLWIWVGLFALLRLLWGLVVIFGIGIGVGLVLAQVPAGDSSLLWAAGIVGAGIVYLLVVVSRSLFARRWRARFWQAQVVSEFLSWRLPPRAYWRDHHQVGHLHRDWLSSLRLGNVRGLRWLRTPISRWVLSWVAVRKKASEEQRWRWARRWAAARELNVLVFQVVLLTLGFMTFGLVLWRYGLVSADMSVVEPVRSELVSQLTGYVAFSGDDALVVALGTVVSVDYLYGLASLLPGFDLVATVLGWAQPAVFGHDRVATVLTEVFQLAMLLPLLAYLAQIFGDRSAPQVKRAEFIGPMEKELVTAAGRAGLRRDDPKWMDKALAKGNKTGQPDGLYMRSLTEELRKAEEQKRAEEQQRTGVRPSR